MGTIRVGVRAAEGTAVGPVAVEGHHEAPCVVAPGSTLGVIVRFTPGRDCPDARIDAALRVFVPIVVFSAPAADLLAAGDRLGAGRTATARVAIDFPPGHPDFDGSLTIGLRDADGPLFEVAVPITVR